MKTKTVTFTVLCDDETGEIQAYKPQFFNDGASAVAVLEALICMLKSMEFPKKEFDNTANSFWKAEYRTEKGNVH